ncbi:hypothetical protein C4D60_Mb06t34820 [Musa balbisiana]|uniref:RCC1-like domain-containing protein n=1 Tax=Musa balbisiana TaxID=52838 RepID=A0A4S8ISU1_MUSBA|nr:hypothetical protein C4D60_Mb06t34820 [Musa balbisiana]
MNGGEAGGRGEEMEEDRKEVRGAAAEDEMVKEEEGRAKEKSVLMWGYLPGVSSHRSPLLYPVAVRMPDSAAGDRWMDVSGGGCGFAMAISESGKLFTWGSTDDMGQSYVTSGKHEEASEVFHLPTEVPIVKAAAGWAHCVAVAANGEVYTWGWKECVPTGRIVKEQSYSGGTSEKEERHSGSLSDQVSPRLQGSRIGGVVSEFDTGCGEKNSKRRRLSSAKVEPENKSFSEETLSALPCLVTLDTGVRIASVAAGGRHTLALSDVGQVWGWGYGGEGQLGLGSRIRNVSSPHPIPCVESASFSRDQPSAATQGKQKSGKLFTWGSTDDMGQSYVTSGKHEEASEVFHLPTEVPIVKAAAGWAHCVAVAANGEVYTWGWKECVPTGRIVKEQSYSGGTSEKEERHSGSLSDQVSPRLQGSRIGGVVSEFDTGCGEKNSKRRRLSSAKVEPENKSFSEETLSALPCLVTLDTGVRIASVAAGGRHTLALSDTGALLTFGWGLYGQCGQGSTNDQLSPKCVSSLLGVKIHEVAAGLWHTICTSVDGGVFSFGGNQFGQLGTGSDQAEEMDKYFAGDGTNMVRCNLRWIRIGQTSFM